MDGRIGVELAIRVGNLYRYPQFVGRRLCVAEKIPERVESLGFKTLIARSLFDGGVKAAESVLGRYVVSVGEAFVVGGASGCGEAYGENKYVDDSPGHCGVGD